jgi:hypothetical protein
MNTVMKWQRPALLHTETVLSRRIALIGCALVPLHRFLPILNHAFALRITDAFSQQTRTQINGQSGKPGGNQKERKQKGTKWGREGGGGGGGSGSGKKEQEKEKQLKKPKR